MRKRSGILFLHTEYWLRHARQEGERAGEEHHVHVRQPQEMTNDEHQREGQVGGELERGDKKAEEYHVVTNTASRRRREVGQWRPRK